MDGLGTLRTIWTGGFVRYGGRTYRDARLAKYAKRNGGRDTCTIVHDGRTWLRVVPWGARLPIDIGVTAPTASGEGNE